MDWFRSYHGAPTDPKWRMIGRRVGLRAGDVAAIAWALMDYASQQQDRGSVAGFDPEELAAAYDYEPEQIAAVIAALEEKRFIEGDHLRTWQKRQPKREDDSSDRVRAYRERQKAAREASQAPANDGVTQCNAGETQGNAPEKSREEKRKSSSHQPSSARGDSATDPDRDPDSPAATLVEDPAATPAEAPAATPEDIEAQISAVIVAANSAMTHNASIDQQRLRPIPTTGGGRQDVLDWIQEGIPIELILEVVEESVLQYRPDGYNRQISRMSYFDAAIRQRHELRQAKEAGGNGQRDHTRRSAAKGRGGTANGGSAKPGKYDSLTIWGDQAG